mmetsp:Transcript_84156/g.162405  ORF Transcript_84156/g.162405 Transcript_84156/m.162405 type:complete len:333 (+) Transcript_84156:3-1001(+)
MADLKKGRRTQLCLAREASNTPRPSCITSSGWLGGCVGCCRMTLIRVCLFGPRYEFDVIPCDSIIRLWATSSPPFNDAIHEGALFCWLVQQCPQPQWQRREAQGNAMPTCAMMAMVSERPKTFGRPAMSNGSMIVATTKRRMCSAKLKDSQLANLKRSGPTKRYDNINSDARNSDKQGASSLKTHDATHAACPIMHAMLLVMNTRVLHQSGSPHLQQDNGHRCYTQAAQDANPWPMNGTGLLHQAIMVTGAVAMSRGCNVFSIFDRIAVVSLPLNVVLTIFLVENHRCQVPTFFLHSVATDSWEGSHRSPRCSRCMSLIPSCLYMWKQRGTV